MKVSPPELFTPVYLKTSPDMPWPEDESVFHLLTADGLFLCRNHPFFRSSVPVSGGPSELAVHESFAKLAFPPVPRRLFERIVGYFALAGERHGAEAAVLLAWNRTARRVEAVIPEQRALVSTDSLGRPFPLTVSYDTPALPPDLLLFGDIHSHVDGPAYASGMDVADEINRPGLHIVVGRVRETKPDIFVAVTIDRTRFNVTNHAAVIEGFTKSRPGEVPEAWFDRLTVQPWCPSSWSNTHYPLPGDRN